MRLGLAVFAFVLQAFVVDSLIVPDEIPTILSVIYSNIPVLKKGTDSRLGWGFRLGNRADFQVLVELGPQTYTQPLANQGGSSNKRHTPNSLSDTLYAQRQQQKNKQKQILDTDKQKQISDTEGGKWLENWSQSVQTAPKGPQLPPGAKPGLAEGEIDAKSVIPEDSVLKLEGLLEKIGKESDSVKGKVE